MKRGKIWAVGGGKGGTGKSFITSSMGTALALKGSKTILIDADLGGANLHTFFGLNRPRYSLSDFFDKKVPLQEIILQSGIPNLGLITGSIGSLDSEGINHAQKQKLFRHIRTLDADHILIDLGAGTHNNTLDTFLLADNMIVVTVPEITALENMYHFIKSAYFRKMKFIFKTYNLNATIQDLWKNRASHNISSLKDLITHLKESSDHIRNIFDSEMSGFAVHIIVNQVRTPRDILVGLNLKSVCMNFMGLPVIYSGYSRQDDAVQKNINSKEPFMIFNRLSPVVKEVKTMTENILTGTNISVRKDLDDGCLSKIL
ncbi:MAG: P-loop NTPase [Desulfuromonadaceae bacterium]|nr:P-loop NTPase [Desulfuromonadaceae bacterium]